MTTPFSKIALIYPPIVFDKSYSFFIRFNRSSIYPPLNIYSLAAYLKRRSPKVNLLILDGNLLNLKDIVNRLIKFKPKIVGLSPIWCSYENALKIVRLCKLWGAKVILGGHYAAALAEEIIKNRGSRSKDYCVDAVCRQDGEEAFYEIVSGKSFAGINNLAFQTKSGIKFNPVKFFNLDKLPTVYDLLAFADIESYRRWQIRNSDSWGLAVYSRKGCAWQKKTGGCVFCSMMSDNRYKSAGKFFEDMDGLIKKYRPDYLFDVADNFLDNLSWLDNFYNLYKNYQGKPKLQIYARLDNLTSRNLLKLEKINTSFIIVGMESGSDAILAKMKKGYSSRDILKTCRILANFNIEIAMSLVLGSVGENQETLKTTLLLTRRIKKENSRIKFQPFFLKPLPGSPAYKLFIGKTGSKYLGKDMFDPMEMYSDWLKNFTRVDFKQVEAASRYLLDL